MDSGTEIENECREALRNSNYSTTGGNIRILKYLHLADSSDMPIDRLIELNSHKLK